MKLEISKKSPSFEDVRAEMTVSSGILKYGRDAYVDCDGLLDPNDFSDDFCQLIFTCADSYYKNNQNQKMDYAGLLSTARKIGVVHKFDSKEAKQTLRAMYNSPIELPTVGDEAKKLFRLRVLRDADQMYAEGRRALRKFTGDESLPRIISAIENPVLDFTASMNEGQEGIIQIAKGGQEWLENVLNHPRENIGVPSPFPKWNEIIGGGCRRRSISLLGARMKTGKTFWGDNVGLHVSGTLGLPTFNLDTEMTQEEHLARILAHITGIPIRMIEKGKVNPHEVDQLKKAMDWLESIPYYYESVMDNDFESHIASIRRWVVKHVGTETDGRTKDCLVVYDYLQPPDAQQYALKNVQEYQQLGYQTMAMLRVAKRCDIPILSLTQLNRQAIQRLTTGIVVGSDRILMKVANFTVLAKKEIDEIAQDGPNEGNMKMVPLVSRHGDEFPEGDYISLHFDRKVGRMTEGRLRSEIHADQGNTSTKGFVIDDDDETQLRKTDTVADGTDHGEGEVQQQHRGKRSKRNRQSAA